MPVISRGVPAYASTNGGAAGQANDADYSTEWRSTIAPSTANPQWLAYDLSTVPAARRGNVVYAWYNNATGDYFNPDVYYSVPGDYTIEANAAPGGTAAPTSGWVNLATVTGNVYTGRSHPLDLSGYSWVRIRVTAARGSIGNTDVSLHADIHDASQGNLDSWLMLGDSITMEGFLHENITGSAWSGGNYAQLINAAKPSYFPLVLDGGNGGMNMAWANTNKADLLAPFSGRYVGIAYGTNDANQSSALTSQQVTGYYTNLLGVVDYILARNQVPVVPHIPWGCDNSNWLGTNAKTLNDYVDQHLFADRPQVVRGPDLWTFFKNNPSLLHDCIHPTYTAPSGQLNGYEQLQRQWRDAMLANVYNASGGAVTMTPTSLTFPGRTVGTTSPSQSVTLTNSGNADLTISGISIMGTNATDFTKTSTCPITPSTLAASASCSISVTFTPSAAGSRAASVSITDDTSGSPHSVALSGTGIPPSPAVMLNPASLTFGSQNVGSTSSSQASVLTNSGTVPLTISSIGVTGANAGDYAQTNNCPASVAVNASCTISVTFAPSASGTRTASVSIADSASGSPHTVGLSGTGMQSGPAVTLAPTSLAFGNQRVGTTSAAKSMTLTNSGNAALTISTIGFAGTNAGDYGQTNDCPLSPATLGVNTTCTIRVTFTPGATGTRTASVTIADNATGSPHTAALTGTGTQPAVTLSPTNLTFSGRNVNTTSPAQSVTLRNSGTDALAITSIAPPSGADPADFAQTNTCPTAPSLLAAGSTCTVSVTFTPSASGSRTASISITDDAPGSPHSIPLSGTGARPGAIALDRTLGTKSDNVGSNNITLTTAGAAAAGSRVFVFVNWTHATRTLSAVTGGGLTWSIDTQAKATNGNTRAAIASADGDVL